MKRPATISTHEWEKLTPAQRKHVEAHERAHAKLRRSLERHRAAALVRANRMVYQRHKPLVDEGDSRRWPPGAAEAWVNIYSRTTYDPRRYSHATGTPHASRDLAVYAAERSVMRKCLYRIRIRLKESG